MPDTKPRRMGRPTLDQSALLQQRILDQTLEMLRAAGSEGFSVDQLATRTGVTKRTIYRHYKTKTGLVLAVVSREVDRLLDVVVEPKSRARRDIVDPVSDLRQWAKRFFDYLRTPENIAFSNYMYFESSSDIKIRNEFVKFQRHLSDHVCQLIIIAQNHGAIRLDEPRRFSLLLLDLLAGMHFRAKHVISIDDMLGGDEPDRYFDFRWQGFLSLVSNQDQAKHADHVSVDASLV